MEESIRGHFSKTVDDYDTVSDKVVFGNDELHDELVGAISFDKDRRLRILDLGCGTGHEMSLILRRFPNAEVVGIDFSPVMIAKSKDNLESFSDRVSLSEVDFRDCDFDGKFDVVVSAVAIHNISHEEKRVLFERVFEVLSESGLFVNADFYEGESVLLNDCLKSMYRKFLISNLSGDELEVWLRHAFEEDMPMRLSEQFFALKDVGFDEVELLWMLNNEAVYVARK